MSRDDREIDMFCGGASQKRPWRLISELRRAEIRPVPRAVLFLLGEQVTCEEPRYLRIGPVVQTRLTHPPFKGKD
jgi:hypothetical protein